MNRQAKETRENIVDAFLDIMQGKPLRRVTVREITDKAGISRVAFYYHYEDVYDLFAKIQEQSIQAVASLLEDSLESSDSSQFERKFFSYVSSNQPLLAVLAKEGLAPSFILQALHATKRTHRENTLHLEGHLAKTGNQAFVDYQFIYMAGGTLFMVFDWIAGKQDIPSDKVAMLAELFNHQVGCLSSRKQAR